MKGFVLSMLVGFGVAGTAHAKKMDCEGIFPKNDRWISSGAFVDTGISQKTFNDVLDKMVAIYNPIVAAHGFKLDWKRLWDDGTVNSDTYTDNGTWIIDAYGGLARYTGMTADGYAAVACHEMGHHMGGAPVFDGDVMSVEGQADYHVGTKCLRKYFAADDNVRVMSGVAIDPTVVSKCAVAFVGDQQQIALCERAAMAGFVVADILRDLESGNAISFRTPDPSVVQTTNSDHPHAQCRLDTYFASSVCTASADVEFSQTDASMGACVTGDGARPLCWYHP